MPFPWLAVLISTAISYGLTLVSALLAPRPKAAKPDEIQVPTATEDRIKPYFVGTVRHKSPNCTWYGDFSTKKIKQGGITAILSLGLAPSLGFKYYIGADLNLGWGKLDALRRIEIGGFEAWTGSVSSGSITIDKPELISAGPIKNGFQATVVVYPGDGSQTADSYEASKVGAVPAYKDDVHLVFKGLTSGGAYIGNSATFPEINFDISRYPNTLAVTGGKEIIDTYDANPVCALYEFLTREDGEFGGGFVSSQFNLTNWRAAAATVHDEGIGVSRIITADAEVQTVVADYLKLIDGVINVNMQTGLMELTLARDDYDPDTIPHFTDDDFLSIEYTRGAWNDTTNEVKISLIDRTDDFSDRVAAAQDNASASGNSEITSTSVDIPGISNMVVGNNLAFRELKAISIPLGRMTGSMNRNGYGLQGGSVFKWTSETYGVEAMIFRVAEVSEGKLEDGTIELQCIEDVFALGDAAFSAAPGSDWTPDDVSAVAVSTQAAFQQPTGFHGTADKRIFTVAKRPNTAQQAYDLWTKKSTDSSYSLRVSGAHFTPTGTVQTNFTTGVSTTLTVTPDTDMDDLPTPVAATEINNGSGLILIGSEILAYTSYTIVGGNYVFAGVNSHLGLYGTTPANHLTGARVWFISEGMGLDTTNYPAGATVNCKLLSVTPIETLAIASASATSVTVDSSTITGIVSGIGVDGTPADGDVIVYDAGSGTFVYEAPTGGGALTDGDYGDVVVSGTGTVMTIDNDVVTNAKAANMATKTYKGRTSSGTGDPEDVPVATLKTDLGIAADIATALSTAESYTDSKVTALINGAPGILDTLEEIADSLNDDANFAGTMATALALKAPLASPTFTGDPKAPTPSPGDNDTSIATTAFVTAAVAAATPAFSETTVSKTTATLANNAIETGTISIGRQFVVKKVISDQYAEIRLYGSAAARAADASRVFGDLSFIGTQSKYILGLLLDVVTGLTWFMSPPAVGENCDSPTSSTIYYSIKNLSGSSNAITVDFKVLVFEA